MRILIGVAIGVLGTLYYVDPSMVEPVLSQAKEIIYQIGNFLVDKTG
jgi:hypothetical protein